MKFLGDLKSMTFRYVMLFYFSTSLMACATYQQKVEQARNHLTLGRASEAVSLLEPLAKKAGDDQLLFVFDYATALQIAGQYKESSQYYSLAESISDAKNYHSVSRIAGSFLLNDEFVQYKGDDYEKLLLNVMSSLNFVMLQDRESALVEIRRLNEKLEYFRLEEKKEYDQNTLSMYLSAMLWESDGNWDSAYIDYERAYKRDPAIGTIREDLVRSALKAGRTDTAKKWMKEFDIQSKPEWNSKNYGEVILIYQQGWGPRKVERPRVATAYGYISPGFPMLQKVPLLTQRARLDLMPIEGAVSSQKTILHSQVSNLIYSVEDAAIKTLEASYAPLIAKKIAAFVAKKAASHMVAKENQGLGAIMDLGLLLADRADLRQWSTLPATFQVARLYVPQGRYQTSVTGLGSANNETGEIFSPVEIEVRPKKKTFLNWRSFK